MSKPRFVAMPTVRIDTSDREAMAELFRNAQRPFHNSPESRLIDAYQQLEYLWSTTGSCPCGARMESPNTHPHVTGCPTGRAVAFLSEAKESK